MFCPNCGEPTKRAEEPGVAREFEKSRNPTMARNLLIFGLVWTVVLWIISYAVNAAILGSGGG